MPHRVFHDFYQTQFPEFTLATLPPAAAWKGAFIIVTDAAPAAICYSNGSMWIGTNYKMASEAGTGITTGTDTVYESSVVERGGIIETRILLGVKGLRGTVDGDILGVDGTALYCHLGQITAARNGTIVGGTMICLEVPAGGDADTNLYSAVEGTGVEDAAISTLDETALVNFAGDWTLGLEKVFASMPSANEYLYMVAGDTTDADYTAGIFEIRMLGRRA